MFDPKEKFPRLFGPGVGTVQWHEARIALATDARLRFTGLDWCCMAGKKGQSGTRSHAMRVSDTTSREE